jgi:DNA invertase Pin-like site-specific DNA recombinase
MANGKFVSYLRVSTDKQGASGLGLEAQRAAVNTYLNGGDWTLLGEFVEVESGKNSDRPKLREALEYAEDTGATLLIAKLDRLSRNVHFLSGLLERGVDFVACDMPSANKLTVHIMAAMAEHEREAISERTRVALKAAKERGTKLGNPNGAAALRGLGNGAAVEALKAGADAHAQKVHRRIQRIKDEGVLSLKGIAERLNAQNVLTARGGKWHPTTVANLLRRVEGEPAAS